MKKHFKRQTLSIRMAQRAHNIRRMNKLKKSQNNKNKKKTNKKMMAGSKFLQNKDKKVKVKNQIWTMMKAGLLQKTTSKK